MDFSLIIGIAIGVAALLTGYILEHGVISSLFLLSPFIIVFGGTMGAVVASFSLTDIATAMRAMIKSFRHPHSASMEKMIAKISNIATRYRTDGVTCLEEISRDPELDQEEYLLLKEGLVLIQELKSPESIQYTLESDIRAYVQQKNIEASVFEAAGGFSPPWELSVRLWALSWFWPPDLKIPLSLPAPSEPHLSLPSTAFSWPISFICP